MDTNEQNQQDKRELRHKRRQRNQIIAYTAVGIMILLLAVGIAFAVSKITSPRKKRQWLWRWHCISIWRLLVICWHGRDWHCHRAIVLISSFLILLNRVYMISTRSMRRFFITMSRSSASKGCHVVFVVS